MKNSIRRAVLALAALLLCLSSWLASTPRPASPSVPHRAPASIPAPSQTERARGEPRPASPTLPPPPNAACTWALAPDPGARGTDPLARFGSAQWFPTSTEAPFRDHPAAERLQTLLDREASGESSASLAAEQRALIEDDLGVVTDAIETLAGPDGEDYDPWDLLLLAEFTRREQELGHHAMTDAAYAGHGIDPASHDRREEASALGVLATIEQQELNYAVLGIVGDLLVELHPDHPATEFGRLYIVWSLLHPDADAFAPTEGAAEAMALLAATHDSLVARAAVQAAMPWVEQVTPDEAALLDQWWPDLSYDPMAARVAALAQAAGDPDGRWSARVTSGSAHATVPPVGGPRRSWRCVPKVP